MIKPNKFKVPPPIKLCKMAKGGGEGGRGGKAASLSLQRKGVSGGSGSEDEASGRVTEVFRGVSSLHTHTKPRLVHIPNRTE